MTTLIGRRSMWDSRRTSKRPRRIQNSPAILAGFFICAQNEWSKLEMQPTQSGSAMRYFESCSRHQLIMSSIDIFDLSMRSVDLAAAGAAFFAGAGAGASLAASSAGAAAALGAAGAVPAAPPALAAAIMSAT